MNKFAWLFLGAALASGAWITGCGGDDKGDGDGGGSGEGGGGEGGGGAELNCDTYCGRIAANCTDDNEQYGSEEICLAVCATWKVGTEDATPAENSLGCRAYHAGAAEGDPDTHCNHAGPTGGDPDNATVGGSVCGDGCQAFCAQVMATCTDGNQQYSNQKDCENACKDFAAPDAGDVYAAASAATATDFLCYVYHANAATQDPGTHCEHTKVGTSPCDPPAP